MLTAKIGWAERINSWTDQGASQAENFRLQAGEVRSLRRDGRRVQVLAGTGWLTMAGRDYILDPGQSLTLGNARERALLSAVDGASLRVEVQ